MANTKKKVAVPYNPTVIFLWMGGNVHLEFNVKDEAELLEKIARFEFGDGEVIDGDYDMPCTNQIVLSDITAYYYAPGALKQTNLVIKKGTKKAKTRGHGFVNYREVVATEHKKAARALLLPRLNTPW